MCIIWNLENVFPSKKIGQQAHVISRAGSCILHMNDQTFNINFPLKHTEKTHTG